MTVRSMQSKNSKVNWRNWERLLNYLKERRRGQVKMEVCLKVGVGIKQAKSIKQAREKPCGTVGCIAGWGMVLFSTSTKPMTSLIDRHITRDVQAITRKALGLDARQMDYLFLGEWSCRFRSDLRKKQVIEYMTKALAAKDVFIAIEH